MTVEIKELSERRVAYMEHRGDPMKLGNTVEKLIKWSREQSTDLKRPGMSLGMGYNDPRDVAPEDFCFDLCKVVPAYYLLDNQVKERIIPAGRYATVLYKGSRHNIGDTIQEMYNRWLPESGEEFEDYPCIMSYLNFHHEVAETELLTEIQVLLK